MTSSRQPVAPAATDRLFLGVPVPDALRMSLERHLDRTVGERGLPGRPVPPRNWHLTLRFLGESGQGEADHLRAALRDTGLGPAFGIRFGACGAFPSPARASVLWLGVDAGADALGRLAAVCESAARRAGFAAESRPFRAHLTLARIRPPRDLGRLVDALPAFGETMTVDAAVLFRSRLGGGPPRYEIVERFSLGPRRSRDGDGRTEDPAPTPVNRG